VKGFSKEDFSPLIIIFYVVNIENLMRGEEIIKIFEENKNKKKIERIIRDNFEEIFQSIDVKTIEKIYKNYELNPQIEILFAKLLFRFGENEKCKYLMEKLRKKFLSLPNYYKEIFLSIYSALLIEDGEINKCVYYLKKGLKTLPKKFTINFRIFKKQIENSYLNPESSYRNFLNITKRLKDKRKYATLLIEEGFLNLYKGKFEKAIQFANESFEISKKKGIYDTMIISSCLISNVERIKGNFDKSYEILKEIEEDVKKASFLGKYYFLIENVSLKIDKGDLKEAKEMLSNIDEEKLPQALKPHFYLLSARVLRKEENFEFSEFFLNKLLSMKSIELIRKWEGLIEKIYIGKFEENKILKIFEEKKFLFLSFLFKTGILAYHLRKNEIENAKKLLIEFKDYPIEFYGHFLREAKTFYKIIEDIEIEFFENNPFLKEIIIKILSNKEIALKFIKNKKFKDLIKDVCIERKIFLPEFLKIKDENILSYFEINPPRLNIKFFGNFEINLEDEKIYLNRKKLRQFLKILVFLKNRWVSKEKIIEILYGKYDERYSKKISILFSFLKNKLFLFVEREKNAYRFIERKNTFIDYFYLKEEKIKGDVFFEKGDYKEAIIHYENFINETEKEFLNEDKDIEFFNEIILEINRERISALKKIAFIYENLKEDEKEIYFLEKIIKIDPLYEFPYKKLISIYENKGERIKAEIIRRKYEEILKNL
jgi:DNA-binding SARP family transcriptional activator